MKPQNTQAPSATAPATPVPGTKYTHTTPGPWRAEGWEKLIVNALDGSTIVACPGASRNAPLTELQANARLIAAAPALLAALLNVESRLDRWALQGITRGPSGKDADWPTLLTQIHDALRRAEGGRPPGPVSCVSRASKVKSALGADSQRGGSTSGSPTANTDHRASSSHSAPLYAGGIMYPDYDDGPPDSFLASALRFAGWLLLIALASALIHWFTGSPYTPGGDAMP